MKDLPGILFVIFIILFGAFWCTPCQPHTQKGVQIMRGEAPCICPEAKPGTDAGVE